MATFRSLSLLAECLKIEHGLELLESQGIVPLQKYFTKMFAEALTSKTKATKNLAMDINFKAAAALTEKLAQ